MVLSPYNRRTS